MKTLTVDTENATLLQTILENELFKLEFNLTTGFYVAEEKDMVIKETDAIAAMIKQLQDSKGSNT